MRAVFLVLGLVALCGHSRADDPDLGRVLAIQTVSDLAQVCRGLPTIERLAPSEDEIYRLISCISYVRGAQALYSSYQSAFRTQTFCAPERATLSDRIGVFVDWAAANQPRQDENAAQGFIVSLIYGYPCAGPQDDEVAKAR